MSWRSLNPAGSSGEMPGLTCSTNIRSAAIKWPSCNAIGCMPSTAQSRRSSSDRSPTYFLIMKSLMSRLLAMTSFGPMAVAFSWSFAMMMLACYGGLASAPCGRARRGWGSFECEIGDEELALAIGGAAARGPHQPPAVGAEDGQTVESVVIGNSLFGCRIHVHHVELVVRVAVLAGRVDDVDSVGVPIGAPVDEFVLGQRPLGRALGIVDVDLKQVVALSVASVDD